MLEGGGEEVTRKPQLELSFEYLVKRERLEWVTITTNQAILISVCLQSMVDELLNKKVPKDQIVLPKLMFGWLLDNLSY